MAVVEVSLLSGFRPHRPDLDKLRDVVDRWISHYELDGARLVLYLDEVPPQRQCLSFGATQDVAVGQLQPAMAVIYDYYEPARRCTVFYSAPRRSSTVATLCSPKVCECAQGQDAAAAPGERRRILVRESCTLRLRSPNTYLVMGLDGGTRDPQGRPQYLLGPQSWVEEVPSPARCGATRLRSRCAQLQDFRYRLGQLGCQL